MIAAGISEDAARSHFEAGLVHLNGSQVTDLDAPMEADGVVTLREPAS